MYYFFLAFPFVFWIFNSETMHTLPKFIFLLVFIASTCILLVMKRHYWTALYEERISAIEKIAAVFLGLLTLSTVFSVDRFMSVYGSPSRFEGLLALFSYCCLLVFAYRLIDFARLKKVLPVFVICSIPLSLYGILQHYSLDFLPQSVLDFGPRSPSLFGNPNFFGSYLTLILLISFTLYLTQNAKKHNRFYFLASCIGFAVMVYSGTRSAWMGVFFGALFITVLIVKKRRELWKKWAVLLASMGLIFLVIDSTEEGGYMNRLLSTIIEPYNIVMDEATGKEGTYRLFIWRQSLPLVDDYMWLGSGPDTFKLVFPNGTEETKKYFKDTIVDKAHNEYLQMAVTMGVPALIVYLVLVAAVVRRALKAASIAAEEEKIILFGLVSTIAGYLIQAFFNISVVSVAPLYWSVLGMTYGLAYHFERSALRQKKEMASPIAVGEAAKLN